jgi:hypothetical protein
MVEAPAESLGFVLSVRQGDGGQRVMKRVGLG